MTKSLYALAFLVSLFSQTLMAQDCGGGALCPGACTAWAELYVSTFSANERGICTTVSGNHCDIKTRLSPDGKFLYVDVILSGPGNPIGFPVASCIEYASATPDPTGPPPIDNGRSPICPANSSINIDSLALEESIPLVGLNFNLEYSSDRFRPDTKYNPKALGLGGWSPTIVHFYNFQNSVMYYGNGGIRNVQALSSGAEFYATDEQGNEVFYFNSSGQHVRTKDALTGSIKYIFTYTSDGTLSEIQDGYGNLTTITTSSGQILITSPFGQVSAIALDSNGFLSKVTNPNHESYSVTNSQEGYLLTFTRPNGHQSVVTYDSAGRVTKDQGAGGDFLSLFHTFNVATGSQDVKMSTALSRVTQFNVIGTNANVSHLIIAPTGAQASSKDILNGEIQTVDAYSNLYLAEQSPDARFGSMVPIKQQTKFMVFNSPISIVQNTTESADLSNPSDPFSFKTFVKMIQLQNDPSRVYVEKFQSANRTMLVTTPEGRTNQMAFDQHGQVIAAKFGSIAETDFSYDSFGRLVRTKQDSRRTVLTYDRHSNVASETDSLGLVTSYVYDNANRLVSETTPSGAKILRSYDSSGNLIGLTPPGRPTHIFEYNLFDLVAKYLPPIPAAGLSGSTIYSYNLDKQITNIAKPSGRHLTLDYATDTGLLSAVKTPEGNVTYDYFTNSDLVKTLSSPDGIVMNYQYAGNIPLQTLSSGAVNSKIAFSFNSDGTLASRTIGGASTLTYAYDRDALPSRIGDEQLKRNENTQISKLTIGKIAEDISYNGFGEMVGREVKAGKRRHAEQKLIRDNLGRVTDYTLKGREEHLLRHFEYDSMARLAKVFENGHLVRSYHYDQNDNRIEARMGDDVVRGEFDSQDRLIRYGHLTYTYDADGNLIKKTLQHHEHEKPRVTEFNYDSFGHLKSVHLPDGKMIEYLIDGLGRRVGKKINSRLIKSYLYENQDRIVAEMDSQGLILQEYVYGEKANIPDYVIAKEGRYRIVSNQVGTPEMLVDVASGRIVKRFNFDEFGRTNTYGDDDRDDDDERGHEHGINIPFGFAGGLLDTDTGLTHFGAREYDPETGRWLSRDPILFAGGDTNLYGYVGTVGKPAEIDTNLYGYTMSDPVNFIDPSGLSRMPAIAPPEGGTYTGCEGASCVQTGTDIQRVGMCITAGCFLANRLPRGVGPVCSMIGTYVTNLGRGIKNGCEPPPPNCSATGE